MHIRIATRRSALALWQAEHVAARLRTLDGVDDVELVPLSTRGDEVLDRSLQKIGGKGLFIKELEVAMADGRADIAVHSMKDVPVELPDGFVLAAMLPRASHADALLLRTGNTLDDLPKGAGVGSSSLRRQAQLKRLRPDLDVRPLRGNVNTRIARLDSGDYDAIVLAAAGLERLGLDTRISHRFTSDEMLPAAGQGVIGIECRTDADPLRNLLAQLDDAETARTTRAERRVAGELGASCQSPVAAFAVTDGQDLQLEACVALPDGSEYLRERATGTDPDVTGRQVADALRARGAEQLLARCNDV